MFAVVITRRDKYDGLLPLCTRVLSWMMADILFQYITSHSGQFSLLLSAGWEMNTGQTAVAIRFSWEGNHWSDV